MIIALYNDDKEKTNIKYDNNLFRFSMVNKKKTRLPEQLPLPHFNTKSTNQSRNNQKNKLSYNDRKFHDWYRFVLSFPPHLVRDYLNDFNICSNQTVLDPFCGTGTTVVECKLNNIKSIGIEANPFPYFASSVKTNWSINSKKFIEKSEFIANNANKEIEKTGFSDNTIFNGNIEETKIKILEEKVQKLLIKNSISPIPLHKTIILLNHIEKFSQEPFYEHLLLALGNALVSSISNLYFGPEVGVKKVKSDAPVISPWLKEVERIATDIHSISNYTLPESKIFLGDSRYITKYLKSKTIDAIITSPPYPNEKDYTRTTRLESVMLGFIKDIKELRSYKKKMLRSNTRGVYKGDDDYLWINENETIKRIADEIENRRIELKKTSGFEKLYSTVTKLYFGGMAKHFIELKRVLKPGAKLAYVVGDQASYLRVMIRTGKILAEIAQSLGYEIVRIDLFRTRKATATRSELREEVLVLQWNG